MIKVHNLIKSYQSGAGELVVLKNIGFSVRRGEFLAITGRSGSGKSTLLYQLGLLDFPNSGKIFIDGLETSTLSGQERTAMRLLELGYIFQDYALLPSLSALENVMIPLLMQGMSPKDAKIKAMRALDRVGLGDKLVNLPSQLSWGQ